MGSVAPPAERRKELRNMLDDLLVRSENRVLRTFAPPEGPALKDEVPRMPGTWCGVHCREPIGACKTD